MALVGPRAMLYSSQQNDLFLCEKQRVHTISSVLCSRGIYLVLVQTVGFRDLEMGQDFLYGFVVCIFHLDRLRSAQ